MRRPSLLPACVALLAAAPACSRAPGPGGPPSVQPVAAPVRVEVTNRFGLPVDIYAYGANSSQRLGTVNPGLRAQFVIPPALLASGSLELRAVTGTADGPASSGTLLVTPGDVIEFQVGSQLFNSVTNIRR